MKYSIHIVAYNVAPLRDLNRLEWVLYSWSLQDRDDYEVIINVSGTPKDFRYPKELKQIRGIAAAYDFARVITTGTSNPFNLAKMLNECFIAGTGEYNLGWNVDCMPRHDYLNVCDEFASADNFLVCIPNNMNGHDYKRLREQNVKKWQFPKHYPLNPGGKTACGMSCTHRQFFSESGGYDERQINLTGGDEAFLKRAKIGGKRVIWLNDRTQIMHLPHRTAKPAVTPQMVKNWKIRDATDNIDWRKCSDVK